MGRNRTLGSERGEFEFEKIGQGQDDNGKNSYRLVQKYPVFIRQAPEPAGRVLMEEEVFATWAATSLILAVMGTQLTSRIGVQGKVRLTIDIFTITVALLVLLWAASAYYGFLHTKARSPILATILALIVALFITLIVLVAMNLL